MMRHSIPLRLALSAILAGVLLPSAIFAQSQDSQSVAEAARRARAQKKTTDKPTTKVIDDDTLVVKKGDVQSATAEVPKMPGSADAPAQPASGDASANAPASPNASDDEKARALLKQRVALKEKIKDAQSDLDLLQREFQLDQDAFYSSPDYANNTSGKAKLDAMKQQIADKQQDLDRLKTELAALPSTPETPATTPPKP
jgi:hypothetical protein